MSENKWLVYFFLIILSLSLGIVYVDHIAFGYGFDFQKCPKQCFVYEKSQNVLPFESEKLNWIMDVHMPDGAVWIGLVLSDGNFTAFKNNIAIMAVTGIHTSHIVQTDNYCPVAKFTLIHQDGYISKTKGLENLVLPDYCIKELNPVPVPEFPAITALLISMIAVITIICYNKRNLS